MHFLLTKNPSELPGFEDHMGTEWPIKFYYDGVTCPHCTSKVTKRCTMIDFGYITHECGLKICWSDACMVNGSDFSLVAPCSTLGPKTV